MTRIKIMLWAALFTAMLVSCGNPIQKPDNDLDPLGENEFYARNIKTGKYYKVKAKKMWEGNKCIIWVEEGPGIEENKAKEIAREYDNVIRPKVVDTFSKKNFDVTYEKSPYHFDDMLDYANWLVYGNDKKLTILLLDIKDGYKSPKDSYVAGYFFGGNFYGKGKIKGTVHYSNGRDMIYVDTDPGLKDKPAQTYATFAHELQHLINFVTTLQMGKYSVMDTWIDEGLSSQAEYLYSEEKQTNECEWFINDEEGTIARGNNFFVWDNHREKLAILDEYATVYLFFRWLYLQAAGAGLQSDIFLKVETSNSSNYTAVTDIAREINPAWNNWETLLRTWLIANYYPKNNYGYTGDVELQNKINEKKVDLITTEKTILLYPGEGVYSEIKGSFSPAETSGFHIRYAGLTETTINTSSPPYAGNVLLTFNANTRNTASREIGSLTGVSSLVSRTTARNIQTRTSTGPYVIDARDMLERFKR
jgi:hypothetical protein